jgi:Rod binding domain-containing protein
MIVSALAQAVSQGGGLGLADMIARSATDQAKLQSLQKAHHPGTSPADGVSSPTPALVLDPNAPQPIAMPPVGVTYRRPPPAQIVNETIDMHELLKDRKP